MRTGILPAADRIYCNVLFTADLRSILPVGSEAGTIPQFTFSGEFAPMSTIRYWLVKSEPECFSIDHLAAAPKQTTYWSGVRNYQARNIL